MSSYEQYVEQQTQLFEPERQEKQKQDLQTIYDDLVARFHLLQDSLKDEQARVSRLETLLEESYNAYDTFKERTIELPFSLIYNMFYMQEKPTSLFLCVNDHDKLLWAKAPEEMK
jgi:hypothetical protein